MRNLNINRFHVTGAIFLFIIILIGLHSEPVKAETQITTQFVQLDNEIEAEARKEAIAIKEQIKRNQEATEIACGALLIYGEARNQSDMGKRAVIETALNRKDSIYYPNDLCEVIFQPYQFSFLNENDPNRAKVFRAFGEDNEHTQSARRIAFEAYYRPASERTVTGLHYHTLASKPDWSHKLPQDNIKYVDDHKFYASKRP